MKKNPILTLFAVLLLFITSCKKEYDPLGLNMKDRDLLGYSFLDTSAVVAYSILEDSTIITDMSNSKYANNAVLGDLHDPVFGRTTTHMFSQFLLPGSNVNFGQNPQLDSIVLTLALTGEYYGDTNSRMNIQVYELSEALSTTGKYYTNQMTGTYIENLTHDPSFSYYPKPKSKVKIDTVRYNPHIRIRLKDALGLYFIDNYEKMKTNDIFLNFFKGLYITATTTSPTGCLLAVNFRTSLSAITLYFKNSESKPQRVNFSANSGVNYCSFEHDYTASQDNNFREQVLNSNKEKGLEKLYVQPLFGVKTFVHFPNVAAAFKDQKIVINKAELVLTNIETDTRFPNSTKLNLQAIKEGGVSFIPDDPYYTGDTYSGTYISTQKEYRFIVTRYIQNLINSGESDLGLYIVTTGAAIRGNRVVLAGTSPGDPGQRIRLEIYYTSY